MKGDLKHGDDFLDSIGVIFKICGPRRSEPCKKPAKTISANLYSKAKNALANAFSVPQLLPVYA